MEKLLSVEKMTSKNHKTPVPQGHATATMEALLCLPANAGALRFWSLGLVNRETPFIRDTQLHMLLQCSWASRHVSGTVTCFITRCWLRAQLSTWTHRLASKPSMSITLMPSRKINCLCLYPLPKANFETTSNPDRDRNGVIKIWDWLEGRGRKEPGTESLSSTYPKGQSRQKGAELCWTSFFCGAGTQLCC